MIPPHSGALRLVPPPDAAPSEDVALATACVRASRGHRVSAAARRRLLVSRYRDLYREIRQTKVEEVRREWPVDYLDNLPARTPAEVALRTELSAAIDAAYRIVEVEPDDPEPDDAGPALFDLKAIDAADFAVAEYRHEWLVKGFLVDRQATIVGGDKKCLKTSISLDLAVSLAVAVPVLGRFEVPRPRRVLFISGESGGATLQESMLRVCRAKDVEPEDLRGQLHVSFELPRLNSPDDMEILASYIRAQDLKGRGIEVVILDPLYLCLAAGGTKIDAANLFEVGPLLKRMADLCLEAGATPVLIHHLRKNRSDPFGRPELDDLAYAGTQEFSRQWVMLGRRTQYVPGSGEHRLWLSFGGSAGHSGDYAVDVDEGVNVEDFGGRRWDVSTRFASEAQAESTEDAVAEKVEKQKARDAANVEAARRKSYDDAEAVYDKLAEAGDMTKTALKTALAWSTTRIDPPIQHLLAQKRIWPTQVPGTRGTNPGYGINAPFFSHPPQLEHRTTPDDAGQFTGRPALEPRTPDAGQGGAPPLKGGPSESPVSGVGSGGSIRPGDKPFIRDDSGPGSVWSSGGLNP